MDGQRTSMASRGKKCAAGLQAGVGDGGDGEAQDQNHAQVLKLKFSNKIYVGLYDATMRRRLANRAAYRCLSTRAAPPHCT